MNDASKDIDQKAEQFARLLGRCQRKVFLYVLGLIHNAADAEEVLQETNVILWRKFDDYQAGTSFESWACRVAYFEALKCRERIARQRRVFGVNLVEMLAEDAIQLVDQFDDRRDALEGCLRKLRDVDRALVLRRYQPGATTRRLAEATGRSVQGTRKSLHRIRMTLLECIERTLATEQRR
ncbi:MAG: sigma-70 family RNA polymerase sigma factor [Thermoguttaceae bacterium]